MDYDLETDAAWRTIRAKRHQPPGNASKNPRRLVFAAAMKQSEQFFRLSEVAGYETKPILLYYGLNQAARAIVAVAAPTDEPWELNGHGLGCPGLRHVRSLGDVNVSDKGGVDQSFQRLAQHMGSPTLPQPVQFGQLWASIPEGVAAPLRGSDDLCTAVELQIRADPYELRLERNVESVWVEGLPRKQAVGGNDGLRKLIRERYPDLHGLAPATDGGGVIHALYAVGKERSAIRFTTADSAESELSVSTLLSRGPTIYQSRGRGAVWICPTIASNARPLLPTAAWWGVLYVLSMLARYEPSTWTRMLDIDSSPDAPAVEYVLDEAHRACVNLIVKVLEYAELDAFMQSEPYN